MDFFKPEPDIILLDYQCTLCSNGAGRGAWINAHPETSYSVWIAQETMREWLLPLIRDKYVILITARRSCWIKPTLDRIAETLHWLPQEYYFNPDGAQPPQHKQRIMVEKVFPVHGPASSGRYLALESNAQTRRMYASLGIPAFRIDRSLDSLPG